MNRDEKSELVETMRGVFAQNSLVIVTHYTGLTVAEITNLRRQVRDAGASFKVTKNRLTRIALEGTAFGGLTESFKGPTAITYSVDPVAAAKATVEFAKKNDKLVILCGALGEQMLDAEGVKALATLPSLDELRAKLIGVLQAPAAKIVGVVQAPGSQLARVLQAYATKTDDTEAAA